ncbi:uncharacterized protein LOC108673495 [Hyalella azteca]|uniref:Uncharacterized protein LOC108673495 n=1 Tax=Hyalella azteca TaxID=294128 RepID=A0A8B7NSY7_HYAAZ|nr:uncharacterized protein LOC108673495 [Hyalella azteca]
MAEKCVVSQCCCGCTLRTGALATAIFCLVSAILNVIVNVHALVSERAQSSWFNIIVSVVVLIIAILLLVGVKKERPNLIRIWIYVEIVLVILTLISSLIVFFTAWDFGVPIISLCEIMGEKHKWEREITLTLREMSGTLSK